MIRVLIADDHAIVRKGLAQIASASAEIAMRGEASDFNSLMRLMKDEPCDVMLLDISMPGKNGIDVLRIVREQYPQTHILILSMYAEDQYAIRALNAGAAGYLDKHNAPDCLVTAILTLAQGKRYMAPRIAEILSSRLASDAETGTLGPLADNDIQAMRLIGSGNQWSENNEELHDLRTSLEDEAGMFAANSAIAIIFKPSEHAIELPAKRVEMIAGILHELLSNISNHARATRVDIELSASPTQVNLTLHDNGIALVPEALSRVTATRISRCGGDLDVSGGQFDISGKLRNGTTVKVSLPRRSSPDDPELSVHVPLQPRPPAGGTTNNQQGTAP